MSMQISVHLSIWNVAVHIYPKGVPAEDQLFAFMYPDAELNESTTEAQAKRSSVEAADDLEIDGMYALDDLFCRGGFVYFVRPQSQKDNAHAPHCDSAFGPVCIKALSQQGEGALTFSSWQNMDQEATTKCQFHTTMLCDTTMLCEAADITSFTFVGAFEQLKGPGGDTNVFQFGAFIYRFDDDNMPPCVLPIAMELRPGPSFFGAGDRIRINSDQNKSRTRSMQAAKPQRARDSQRKSPLLPKNPEDGFPAQPPQQHLINPLNKVTAQLPRTSGGDNILSRSHKTNPTRHGAGQNNNHVEVANHPAQDSALTPRGARNKDWWGSALTQSQHKMTKKSPKPTARPTNGEVVVHL